MSAKQKFTFRCRVDKILTTLSNEWVNGYKKTLTFLSGMFTLHSRIKIKCITICPRSLGPLYFVTHYLKWVKTALKDLTIAFLPPISV